MSTVKVLKLENWMNASYRGFADTISRYKEISPIYNRDGIYRTPFACWFEVGGNAYEYSQRTFEFDFKCVNLPKNLGEKEVGAYRVLAKAGLLTEQQREQMYCYEHNKIRRKGRLRSMKIVKDMREKMKNFKESKVVT